MGPLKEPEDTPRDVFMKRRHAQATPGLQACQGHPSAVRTKNQGRVSTPPTPSGPTICPSFPKVQPHGQVARAHPHVTSAHVLALPGTLSACLAQSPPFQFQAHHHQVHRNPSNSCYYTRQAPPHGTKRRLVLSILPHCGIPHPWYTERLAHSGPNKELLKEEGDREGWGHRCGANWRWDSMEKRADGYTDITHINGNTLTG